MSNRHRFYDAPACRAIFHTLSFQRLPFLSFLLLLLLLCILHPTYGKALPPDKTIAYSYYLMDTSLTGARDYFSYTAIKAFYRQRQYQQAWLGPKGLKSPADSLLSFIQTAETYGLVAADYHQAKLEALKKRIDTKQASQSDLDQMDLLFSDSFMMLAYHLHHGRLLKNSQLRLQQLPLEAGQAVTTLLKQLIESMQSVRQTLEQQQPSHLPYVLLKQELGKLLKEGLSATASATESRIIRQLMVNMERWRWESDTFPSSYILVNIPAYRLEVFEAGKPVLESRIIVGKPGTPSPVLNSIIECIIIYPYWTVPRSIAVAEMLPKLQKDPSYLERNHFEVLDRNWKTVNPRLLDWNNYHRSNFPFTLRQSQGWHNALGIVKFMFDNDYSVYLHDTNAPQLFNNNYRALSHGCIRVEKNRELARLLLQKHPNYGQAGQLEASFNTRRSKEINLPAGMPLYIRYFTVDYLHDSLQWYEDIYRHDEKLIRALFAE